MTQPRRPVIFLIPQNSIRAEETLSPTEGTGAYPHNEVERRRKQRITSCIQQLSEILGSSCHCGKETRAETLQRVVDHIRSLQDANKELERKIAQLPQSGSCTESELSSQLEKLLVEHMILRAQLLEHMEKQRSKDNSNLSSEQLSKERSRSMETESLQLREEEDGATSSQQQPWPVTSLLSYTSQASTSQSSCQTTVVIATHHPETQCTVVAQNRPLQQSIVQPWVVGGASPPLHHVNPLPRPSPQPTNQLSYSQRSRTTRHRPYHANHIRTHEDGCSIMHSLSDFRLHSRPPEYGTGHTTQSGDGYSSHTPRVRGDRNLSHPPPPLYTGGAPPTLLYPNSHILQPCDTPTGRHVPLLSHPPPPQVWRPYSEHSRTSGFCLADILSLPSSEEPPALQLPPPPPSQSHTTSRMPSFLVDHLLDDI